MHTRAPTQQPHQQCTCRCICPATAPATSRSRGPRSLDAVRRRLVAQAAVPLGLQLGREQAARADPRVGEAATGDLDAGCYRVRHRLVGWG